MESPEVADALTTDSSGNGNTGTLTGIPAWTTGVASNALDFDGVNDYVSVGNKSTLQSNPTWTFAGWINPDTFNSTRDTYLFYKDSVLLWGMRAATSRQLTVNIGRGSGGNPWGEDTTSSVQLSAGAWTHVAVTYTNSTVRFYVNGTLTNTFSKTYTMGSKNSAFTISTSAQSFDGKLDDMRYYNRALSDGEVAQVYGEQATGSNSVYLADALGSVVALADSNKTIQTWYGYEPFGQSTSHGSPTTNPFTFTGRENDGTGFCFYRARYYHPVLGRFVTEDPMEYQNGDFNLFVYVRNDPTGLIDPFGLYGNEPPSVCYGPPPPPPPPCDHDWFTCFANCVEKERVNWGKALGSAAGTFGFGKLPKVPAELHSLGQAKSEINPWTSQLSRWAGRLGGRPAGYGWLRDFGRSKVGGGLGIIATNDKGSGLTIQQLA